MKKGGVDVDKMREYGIRKLKSDLKKMRGVVVGINEIIFELNIKNGCDQPGEEVIIYHKTNWYIRKTEVA